MPAKVEVRLRQQKHKSNSQSTLALTSHWRQQQRLKCQFDKSRAKICEIFCFFLYAAVFFWRAVLNVSVSESRKPQLTRQGGSAGVWKAVEGEAGTGRSKRSSCCAACVVCWRLRRRQKATEWGRSTRSRCQSRRQSRRWVICCVCLCARLRPTGLLNFLINQKTFFCLAALVVFVFGWCVKEARINAKMMSGNLSSLFTSVT